MSDLEGALASINEIERQRAALIHEAVYDLRGNVFGVTVAAKLIGGADIVEAERVEFAQLPQTGVQSVAAMLVDLKELARLEAGREIREGSDRECAGVGRESGRHRGRTFPCAGAAARRLGGDAADSSTTR